MLKVDAQIYYVVFWDHEEDTGLEDVVRFRAHESVVEGQSFINLQNIDSPDADDREWLFFSNRTKYVPTGCLV